MIRRAFAHTEMYHFFSMRVMLIHLNDCLWFLIFNVFVCIIAFNTMICSCHLLLRSFVMLRVTLPCWNWHFAFKAIFLGCLDTCSSFNMLHVCYYWVFCLLDLKCTFTWTTNPMDVLIREMKATKLMSLFVSSRTSFQLLCRNVLTLLERNLFLKFRRVFWKWDLDTIYSVHSQCFLYYIFKLQCILCWKAIPCVCLWPFTVSKLWKRVLRFRNSTWYCECICGNLPGASCSQ